MLIARCFLDALRCCSCLAAISAKHCLVRSRFRWQAMTTGHKADPYQGLTAWAYIRCQDFSLTMENLACGTPSALEKVSEGHVCILSSAGSSCMKATCKYLGALTRSSELGTCCYESRTNVYLPCTKTVAPSFASLSAVCFPMPSVLPSKDNTQTILGTHESFPTPSHDCPLRLHMAHCPRGYT